MSPDALALGGRRLRRALVAEPRGEFLDLAERLLLLLQVLVEQSDSPVLAHRLRHPPEAFVRGDLVVLGAGRCAHVHDVDEGLSGLLEELVVLLLEPFEADALLDLRLLAEQLEDFLDVGDVLPALLEVRLEAASEVLVFDFVDQLGERLLGKRALDVQDVAELVSRNRSRGVVISGMGFLSSLSTGGTPPWIRNRPSA